MISCYINIYTKVWRVVKCAFGFGVVCGFHFLSCTWLYFPKCLQVTDNTYYFLNKGIAHNVNFFETPVVIPSVTNTPKLTLVLLIFLHFAQKDILRDLSNALLELKSNVCSVSCVIMLLK